MPKSLVTDGVGFESQQLAAKAMLLIITREYLEEAGVLFSLNRRENQNQAAKELIQGHRGEGQSKSRIPALKPRGFPQKGPSVLRPFPTAHSTYTGPQVIGPTQNL